MKIVFVGCVRFSELALTHLLDLGANIVGVVTKAESSVNADFCDLSALAQSNGIETVVTESINAVEVEQWIQERSPDLIVCFGWSSLLHSNILKIPPMGVLGFHPSLLPNNRGRHPIIWALVLGLEKTGSTFFFMNEGADTGDILSQEEIDISLGDDAATLYEKVTDSALEQISNFYPKLVDQTYSVTPQSPTAGNTWRKRRAVDGLVDFRMSSRGIYNLVRALTRPYAGADVKVGRELRKVWKVKEVTDLSLENLEPGFVVDVARDGTVRVKTNDGIVDLIEHELGSEVVKGMYLYP